MSRRYLKNRHHSEAFKLDVVHRYLSGVSVKALSQETDIYLTQIKHWISVYRSGEGLGFSFKNSSYSPELKKEIVTKLFQKELSLHEASLTYRISRSVIGKWLSKVRTLGFDSLSVDNRGRPKKGVMAKTKKNPEILSREQELLIENERLRAENAYLKKLRALVQERILRENGNAPKPSKN